MFSKILLLETQLFENSRLLNLAFDYVQQILLLSFRLWIFNIFFFSGWLKFTSWDTTIMLFEYEYNVQLLSPIIAAYFATAIEIIFPVLLLLGVFPRLSAMILIILNTIATISYADISSTGIQQHILWSVLLIVLLTYGAGKIGLGKITALFK